jgi:hypothetical protein
MGVYHNDANGLRRGRPALPRRSNIPPQQPSTCWLDGLGRVRAEAHGLSGYRAALRRWWTLTALGAEADIAEMQQVYQDIVRLIDELGEPAATRQRRAWAREWYSETDCCPYCGELGAFHEVVP